MEKKDAGGSEKDGNYGRALNIPEKLLHVKIVF